jgi:hypothetical protein
LNSSFGVERSMFDVHAAFFKKSLIFSPVQVYLSKQKLPNIFSGPKGLTENTSSFTYQICLAAD